MLGRAERWVKRYETIETACGRARCVPCTYPYCQRYARVRKAARKAFPA